jgi:hypothetical protein
MLAALASVQISYLFGSLLAADFHPRRTGPADPTTAARRRAKSPFLDAFPWRFRIMAPVAVAPLGCTRDNARLHGARDQLANLVALQRHELVGVISEELWAEVNCVNARIIAFDHHEMLCAREHVGFLEDILFLHTACDADALRRRPDYCAGFKQNHPILVADIIWMNGNEIILRFSFETDPQHPPPFSHKARFFLKAQPTGSRPTRT